MSKMLVYFILAKNECFLTPPPTPLERQPLFCHTRHCSTDAVVIGKAELIWEKVLSDARNGRLNGIYRADRWFDMKGMKPPKWDLLKRNKYLVANMYRLCAAARTRALSAAKRDSTAIATVSDLLKK